MRAERRIELTPDKGNGLPAVGDIVFEDERRGWCNMERGPVDGQRFHGVNEYPAHSVEVTPGYRRCDLSGSLTLAREAHFPGFSALRNDDDPSRIIGPGDDRHGLRAGLS